MCEQSLNPDSNAVELSEHPTEEEEEEDEMVEKMWSLQEKDQSSVNTADGKTKKVTDSRKHERPSGGEE